MVFSSSIFLLMFLPIVFVLNFFVRKEYSNILLLIASLVFYAWGEPYLVFLMMASIVINWSIGKIIAKTCVGGGIRKVVLTVGVVCNLGILGYYKYAGFFVTILNGVCRRKILSVPEIALPIGISFFTFQAISYIVDVYRKEVEPSSTIVHTALYISFFPQLIAGPIVKYKDISKQIEERNITWINVSDGFKRFIYGLSKKVLISNSLALCADGVFSYHITVMDYGMAWIGALAYTFQIYYDFSGYSDMAIGLGKMFGFTIPENFNYPYLSKSITEFWRRWHISLGSWFREYVYIPLGGNRKGKLKTYINLSIVFFLTGLWHGAHFKFILWGLYHGFFIIVERLGFKKILDKSKILSTVYCFFIVNFGWVLFRADDVALGIGHIAHMVLVWKHSDINIPRSDYLDTKTIFFGICAILGMGILKMLIPVRLAEKWKDSAIEAVYCIILLMLCMASVASDTYNPFIYFQF